MPPERKKNKLRSIQLKLAVFFAVVFLALGTALLILSIGNGRRVQQLYATRTAEERENLEHELTHLTLLTKALAPDYSQWDDPYNYLLGKMPNYPEVNLTEATLETFDSDAMWMFNKDGKLLYTINTTEAEEGVIDFTPYTQSVKNMFKTNYSIQFFIKTKTGIMSIFGSTVVATNDPQHLKNSPGYLLTGKLIDNELLAGLKNGGRNKVMLLTPEESQKYPKNYQAGSGTLVYWVDYKDINNQPLGSVFAEYEVDSIRALHNSDTKLLILVASTFFVILTALIALIWRWVIRPLNKIHTALESKNMDLLKTTTEENTEFGKIAQLISRFFEQENLLEKEIESKKNLLDKLAAYNVEIETTNNVMIGRELRMIEMKKELKTLKDEKGSKS